MKRVTIFLTVLLLALPLFAKNGPIYAKTSEGVKVPIAYLAEGVILKSTGPATVRVRFLEKLEGLELRRKKYEVRLIGVAEADQGASAAWVSEYGENVFVLLGDPYFNFKDDAILGVVFPVSKQEDICASSLNRYLIEHGGKEGYDQKNTMDTMVENSSCKPLTNP